MAPFFINRPVFAWVIALFIVIAGLIAIPELPVARYPSVAPPTVTITATYPGASPQTMNDSVVSLIERELSGVKNLLYFESSVDTSGSAQITVTFKPGTDPELAQVDVQNQIKVVEPRLPQEVRQNGLDVESAASGFLMMVSLMSDGNRYDQSELGDYMARNIVDELRRVDGVGKVQLFGAEQAMRIWVNPEKLVAYNLTITDLSAAIEQQNKLVAPGKLGDEPTISGQTVTVPLTVKGQLQTTDDFAKIILKSEKNGAQVHLRDVARISLGSQSYAFRVRQNGKDAATLAIQLSPGANAVHTASAIEKRLDELRPTLPVGMQYEVSFNTAPFVKISIEKVVHTLLEAMVLVFLVMFLFLQNIRYTLIPAVVVPVALSGTFTVILLAGFSVNVLTMFGMVLAIGIIVDDAIVVVENVERLMVKEGLSSRDATLKAMKEITGAIVGITLVLSAVFIPMAFASGSVGEIYRQFTLSMSVSILFSAFIALSLTPALSATLLKPVKVNHREKKGFFGWFNKGFDKLTDRYEQGTRKVIRKSGRMLLLFSALLACLLLGFRQVPSAFLPEEDQGYFISAIQLPADATADRTMGTVTAFEKYISGRKAIESNLVVLGYGFSGSGPNTALAYTTLKDWGKRSGATSQNEARDAQTAMGIIKEGSFMALLPPAIDELGTSSGFTLRIEDRANRGYRALMEARDQLLAATAGSKVVTQVYPDGLPAGSSLTLNVDRQKAQALGVSFTSISDTLSSAMGSLYINDFPNKGRMEQVIIQADAPYRMQLNDLLSLYVRNDEGGMVPLSEVVSATWNDSPLQLTRYQGFLAARISGSAAAGYSSGEAMTEMERLASSLPPGFTLEWSGQSLQEKQSASQAPLLLTLSIIVVFLVLAALYESWAIPLSVIMVIPLGLLGAVMAVLLRDMPNDVFFKVGLVTVIGLSAKNAILIVEFARQLYGDGYSITEAAIKAARLRLRPILMTSFAFALGVVPLMMASGASAETQHAIGTGVFGGMVSATILTIFFVPVFFALIMKLQQGMTEKSNQSELPE